MSYVGFVSYHCNTPDPDNIHTYVHISMQQYMYINHRIYVTNYRNGVQTAAARLPSYM